MLERAITDLIKASILFLTILPAGGIVNRSLAQSVTRGPFLQSLSSDRVTIGWRTDVPTSSKVWYGLALSDLNVAGEASLSTEHFVTITGLQPSTKYFYVIGYDDTKLNGENGELYFYTAPTTTPQKLRIWALGDAGTKNEDQQLVRDAALNFFGDNLPNLILLLGDNAYDLGKDSEYQKAVFEMYGSLLSLIPLWPTKGNHDLLTWPVNYIDIFALPTKGEAGGYPSGTEKYYSFDYGNTHFISLNSDEDDIEARKEMENWLLSDLSQNNKNWTIVFFHHPPYSKGSHDSDNPSDSNGKMFYVREVILPILESKGVDLVLSGHSHSYERSFLLNGYYGISSTLTVSNILDGSSGNPLIDTPYYKSDIINDLNSGTVYIVAGNAGRISNGSLDHPAMFYSAKTLGSLIIDVNNNMLTSSMLSSSGEIVDTFTIIKNKDRPLKVMGLNASETSDGCGITISWTHSDKETSYKLFRSDDPYITGVLIGDSLTATSYTDYPQKKMVNYYYRIMPENNAGSGPLSDVISASKSKDLNDVSCPPTSFTLHKPAKPKAKGRKIIFEKFNGGSYAVRIRTKPRIVETKKGKPVLLRKYIKVKANVGRIKWKRFKNLKKFKLKYRIKGTFHGMEYKTKWSTWRLIHRN